MSKRNQKSLPCVPDLVTKSVKCLSCVYVLDFSGYLHTCHRFSCMTFCIDVDVHEHIKALLYAILQHVTTGEATPSNTQRRITASISFC